MKIVLILKSIHEIYKANKQPEGVNLLHTSLWKPIKP